MSKLARSPKQSRRTQKDTLFGTEWDADQEALDRAHEECFGKLEASLEEWADSSSELFSALPEVSAKELGFDGLPDDDDEAGDEED